MSTLPRSRGFSLLEILVAFAILSLALGVLYRSVGGSARQVADVVTYERADVLAQSLMEAYESVPPAGVQASGDVGGLSWSVATQPFVTAQQQANPRAVRLHALHIAIRWQDGEQQRSLELNTLRPERKPPGVPGG